MGNVITKSIERGTKSFLVYGIWNDGLMLYSNVLDRDLDICNRVQIFHCDSRQEMIERMEEMRDDLFDMICDLKYNEPFGFIDKPKTQEINLEPEVPVKETEEDENDG